MKRVFASCRLCGQRTFTFSHITVPLCWSCSETGRQNIHKLKREYRKRKLLTMRVCGMTAKQIAAAEGISISRVGQILSAAQRDIFRITDGSVKTSSTQAEWNGQ